MRVIQKYLCPFLKKGPNIGASRRDRAAAFETTNAVVAQTERHQAAEPSALATVSTVSKNSPRLAYFEELLRGDPSPFNMAAVLVKLGRLAEARAEVQAGLGLNPGFTIQRYRAGAQSDNPLFPQRTRTDHGGHA